MINTALIGYGLAGRVFHAPLIHHAPDLHLHTIVSSQTETVKTAYPDANVVSGFDAILADQTIDAVVIGTPNALHFPQARAALLAGKHVVVDKPFTTCVADADALMAIAKAQGRVLSVFQNRRWDGDFLTIKKLIEDGALGKLYQFESHFDRFRPTVRPRWREQAGTGSGMLFDLGAHLIDQALQLFGWPEWISADVTGQRPNAVTDDYFHLTLGYGDVRVLLQSCSFVQRPTCRFAVHGERGSFVKHGLDPQEEQLKTGITPDNAAYGSEDPSAYAELVTEQTQRVETLRGWYPDFYAGFAATVRGEVDDRFVSAESARDVIALIEQAHLQATSQHADAPN
jgi:scyllo-inositol 2-dehydrogenase (NADP+)